MHSAMMKIHTHFGKYIRTAGTCELKILDITARHHCKNVMYNIYICHDMEYISCTY